MTVDSGPTTATIVIDEETPLLSPSVVVDAPKKSSDVENQHHRKRKPLAKLQISVILLLQLCEPLMSQSIYPYINQVCWVFGVFIFILDLTSIFFFWGFEVGW